MLYMAGGGRITRVHGPFVSDDEVEKVVAHLKTQGRPHYLDAVTADDEEDGGRGRGRRRSSTRATSARRARRPLRPGRRGRAARQEGLDLLHPAPPADRLQPRRLAHGADGEGRHRRRRPTTPASARSCSRPPMAARGRRGSSRLGCGARPQIRHSAAVALADDPAHDPTDHARRPHDAAPEPSLPSPSHRARRGLPLRRRGAEPASTALFGRQAGACQRPPARRAGARSAAPSLRLPPSAAAAAPATRRRRGRHGSADRRCGQAAPRSAQAPAAPVAGGRDAGRRAGCAAEPLARAPDRRARQRLFQRHHVAHRRFRPGRRRRPPPRAASSTCQRPGKIRFEYDAARDAGGHRRRLLGRGARPQARDPGPLLIGQTPLKFLLRERIDLGQRHCRSPTSALEPEWRPHRARGPLDARRHLARSRCSSTRTCNDADALADRRPAGLPDDRSRSPISTAQRRRVDPQLFVDRLRSACSDDRR